MTIKGLIGGTLAALTLGACATAETPAKPAPVELNTYILLDRTGSMSDIWDEALTSVNAYADSVVEPDDGPEVINDLTFAVFDHQQGFQFDILRDNVSGEDWTSISPDEVSPRGTTPLFDAIGQIIALAEEDNPEKAIIVIMTDGHENASQELGKKEVKAAIERAEARGWQVVFLGAEFANFADADAVGVTSSKQMAVSKDQLAPSMDNLAKKSRSYAQETEEGVEFNADDRALADEEDVKQRKGGN